MPFPPYGPIIYFTADKGTYQDTGFSVPAVAPGDAVMGWKDQSGNAHDASHTNERCTIVSDATVCTNIAVQFDSIVGHQAILQTAPFTWNQPEHLFALVQHLGGSDAPYLWDGRSNDSMVFYWSQTTNKFDIVAGSPFSHECTNSDLTALGTWGIVEVLYNGASSFTRVNNNASVGVSGTMGTASAGGITLGNYNSNNAGAKTKIAVLLGYNTALSGFAAQIVRNWITSVYLDCAGPAGCINFQASIAREQNASDESCNDYGGVTNLQLCGPIAAGHYVLEANVADLNGAAPGDSVRLKIRRRWDDPLNTLAQPCSLVNVAVEYDVT